MFDWGKYFKKDGKVFIPFSIHVHHSFIDGFLINILGISSSIERRPQWSLFYFQELYKHTDGGII